MTADHLNSPSSSESVSPEMREIAIVRGLRHRVETRHSCKCDECRAIKRVCGLATEALAMKASGKSLKRRVRELESYIASPKVGDSVEITLGRPK